LLIKQIANETDTSLYQSLIEFPLSLFLFCFMELYF